MIKTFDQVTPKDLKSLGNEASHLKNCIGRCERVYKVSMDSKLSHCSYTECEALDLVQRLIKTFPDVKFEVVKV